MVPISSRLCLVNVVTVVIQYCKSASSKKVYDVDHGYAEVRNISDKDVTV